MKTTDKISVILTIFLIVPIALFSQLNKQSFEQIDHLQSEEKRNSVVFIYTDWCKYCHAMQSTTLKEEEIVNLLNTHFWYTELNAEETNSISFSGHTFQFKPNGNNTGVHELAEQLATTDGKISFPTLCILNQEYEIIFQFNQFLSASELEIVLHQVLKSQE